ncbi:hypothetical protein JCM10449v2_002978 [Rhodotorula kratochvilovae]
MASARGNTSKFVAAGLADRETVVFFTTALRMLLTDIAEHGCEASRQWAFEVVAVRTDGAIPSNLPIEHTFEIHVRPLPGTVITHLPMYHDVHGARIMRFAADPHAPESHAAVWRQVSQAQIETGYEDDIPLLQQQNAEIASARETCFHWRWFSKGSGRETVAQEKDDLMAFYPDDEELAPHHLAQDHIVVRFFRS